MDLDQKKLTRKEWESIELPIPQDEKEVLKFLLSCCESKEYNRRESRITSVCRHLKLTSSCEIQQHLYTTFYEPKLKQLHPDKVFKTPKTKRFAVKNADKIRISLNSSLNGCYETVLLDLLSDLKEETKKYKAYYTLTVFLKLSVIDKNEMLCDVVQSILDEDSRQYEIENFFYFAQDIIEKNKQLLLCEDKSLYQHQKDIFEAFENDRFEEFNAAFLNDNELSHLNPKFALYVAPTGTGKTLTPIALSIRYRVIFVCAARHVGLSLARSAIAMNRKIAFAFGCKDTSDIRLHNASAVKFDTDFRSGSIRNIDHSIGSKVQMLICDLQSYLYATLYMKAFNHVSNILTFWDEPTISLDVSSHTLHEIIHRNWTENSIPNMVLSSATLPEIDSIGAVIEDLDKKFPGVQVFSVVSHDFKKSIPIIDPRGFVEMPHYLFENYEDIHRMAERCEKRLSVLRYIDFQEIIEFVRLAESCNFIYPSMTIKQQFVSVSDVCVESIKLHYLQVLKSGIKQGCWGSLYLKSKSARQPRFSTATATGTTDAWGVFLSTKDSHTLTDGATLFLTADVQKIASFLIQQSNIPSRVIESLYAAIESNNAAYKRMSEIEKKQTPDEIQPTTSGDQMKSKQKKTKVKDEDKVQLSGTQLRLKQDYDYVQSTLRRIELNEMYVPNKPSHLRRFVTQWSDPFSCDIDNATIEDIMALSSIEDNLKLLLLMGIGAFTKENYKNTEYLEIMKTLATNQKLYLVIADSDYIYGTNYQFCHAYLSKDLVLTQEKLLQCLGRVGRKNIQQNYSVRFRDAKYFKLLMEAATNRQEVMNMNRLFVL
jgi:hypothetical protein